MKSGSGQMCFEERRSQRVQMAGEIDYVDARVEVMGQGGWHTRGRDPVILHCCLIIV